MRLREGVVRFVLVVMAVLGVRFVWWSGQDGLPARVASHFAANGYANGFMPKTAYLVVMSAVIFIAPVLSMLGASSALRAPGARINMPNRDYWLAPARRDATIDTIIKWFCVFGCLLVAILCYAHWLVVQANAVEPAVFDTKSVTLALAAFGAAVVIWLGWFLVYFSRTPQE